MHELPQFTQYTGRQLVSNVRKLHAACHSSGSVPRRAGPTDSALEVLLSAGQVIRAELSCDRQDVVISDSHTCTPPHPTVKEKLVSDRQRPQYTTCCYQNVARLMRNLALAVALCGRFERNTFLRNDGNYMTNDTSSATSTEHIKISYTVRYKPSSEQGGAHNWRSVSADSQLTATVYRFKCSIKY